METKRLSLAEFKAKGAAVAEHENLELLNGGILGSCHDDFDKMIDNEPTFLQTVLRFLGFAN